MAFLMAFTPKKTIPLLAALAAVLAVLCAAGPMADSADARACQRWGKVHPERLTHPEARKAIRCLVNVKRRQHNKGALDRDRRLQRAAQNHSEYMRGHHCFSHQCAGESSPYNRIRHTGYFSGVNRWSWGENIAWGLKGSGSPDQIVDAWMHSPPHRAAILSSSFRDVGVGFVDGSPKRKRAHGGIYTLDFGLRAG